MWRVEKFLGCCDLEKSLVVLIWIGIVFNILSIIGYLIAVIVLSTKIDCQSEAVREMFAEHQWDINNCSMIFTVLKVALIVCIILAILGTVVNYMFIRGVNTRNHRLIAPIMIILAIGAVLTGLGAFLSIFSLHPGTIIYNFLYGFITVYLFLCVYTVYEKVRDEKFNNVQYTPTIKN